MMLERGAHSHWAKNVTLEDETIASYVRGTLSHMMLDKEAVPMSEKESEAF